VSNHEDDYYRARRESDSAGNDYAGNQQWKQAQDDMHRAQQEMEWQRRDAERDRAARDRDSQDAAPIPGTPSGRGGGYNSAPSAPRGRSVSIAIADSIADSIAGTARIHPGLPRLFCRLFARALCWPIPLTQRGLTRIGVRNGFLRFVIILVVWMAYLVIVDVVLLRTA